MRGCRCVFSLLERLTAAACIRERAANQQKTANEKIKGLRLWGKGKKISSYADDIALLISGQASCIEAMRVLKLFEDVSGLKMNHGKRFQSQL